MAADEKLRIPYDGEDLTVQEWSERTGLSYGTIYQRYAVRGWSAKETLTTPSGAKGGRTPGKGPVELARELANGDGWVETMRLAIVLMALHDYENPYYRTDVELFFRHEFGALFDFDGRRVLERLAATTT